MCGVLRVILFLVSVSCFLNAAESASEISDLEAKARLRRILYADATLYYEEPIKAEVSLISKTNRENLYREFRRYATRSLSLSIFLGNGAGSFYRHDIFAGSGLFLWQMSGSALAVIYGVIKFDVSRSGIPSESMLAVSESVVMPIVASSVWLSAYITGIVRSAVIVSKYSKRLESLLRLNDEDDLAFSKITPFMSIIPSSSPSILVGFRY